MKILGLDYGRRKIGVAISQGTLAEPLQVIRYKDKVKMIDHIKRIIEKQKVEKVVVGISEGEMGEESKEFARYFNADTYDETLSSHDAIEMSIQSGMGRKKRKEMEDAFAASIMLQNYIDQL
jgi:putative Holliday junction resolvase